MAKIREIDVAKDIVKEYSTEEVVRFINDSMKNYANMCEIPERSHFNLLLNVVEKLDEKLNGQKGPNLL